MQQIWLSEWCKYNCEFCYNGKNEFKELPIPQITDNCVQILDPAFLSKSNILSVIQNLGQMKVNNKCVYYELVQGINYKDLTQEIANELKQARFINIRFAWDRQYNKFYMFKVYDCYKMLINAGYNPKKLAVYILVNWVINLEDCIKKLDLLKVWKVRVADCCYDGGYHIKNKVDYMINQKPKNWSYNDLKYFRRKCRKHNQVLCGIDPELK